MSEKIILKTLVVDDEKVVRDFLSRYLKMHNMEITAVESGFFAIEAARKDNFDFFFLDIRMPGMNGVELLSELKKISPQAKFIMMTGYAVDNLIEDSKKIGIYASIKKPFDMEQINSLISSKSKISSDDLINVLVADDDSSILDFFKHLLKEDLYSVTTVNSGKQAYELISEREFDLLFLDVMLKDMSGLDLLLKIRETNHTLKIVLITGHPDALKENVGSLQANACLAKPFDVEKIMQEIEGLDKFKKLKDKKSKNV